MKLQPQARLLVVQHVSLDTGVVMIVTQQVAVLASSIRQKALCPKFASHTGILIDGGDSERLYFQYRSATGAGVKVVWNSCAITSYYAESRPERIL